MSGGSKIPKGWIETLLGKHLKVGRGSSPRPIHKYISTEGIPWVKIADASASINKYIEKTKEFIIEEGRSTSVKPGDLIVSNSATPGIPKFMAIDACVHDGWLVFDEYKGINKLYLYYFFLFFRRELNHSATGTVFKNLKTDIVRNIELLLPPHEEQKAIASILTSFDDKIELLQAQNETLEAIAQTIFKEWFGKYQVGDELPEGWRVGKLEEVIEFINGYGFKSKELLNEPELNCLKVFKMGDIKKGGGFNPNKTRSYFKRDDAENLSKFILRNGDILMSMTDMKDAISLLGHTALMIYDDEYIVNQRVGLIRAENEIGIDYPFLYLLTNDEVFIANLRGRANSGVQVNLTTKSIKESPFVIPNKQTNTSFNKVVKPLFEKIKYNAQQIQTLQATRDTLLPKLMSGKVRVDEFKE